MFEELEKAKNITPAQERSILLVTIRNLRGTLITIQRNYAINLVLIFLFGILVGQALSHWIVYASYLSAGLFAAILIGLSFRLKPEHP